MINQKSDYLVILVATYNRLSLLVKSLASIQKSTKVPYEIIVIDGGSTDGTVEYLKKRHDVTSVFQGKLIGTSRAYNRVWRQVRCKYTCWLSDDTEITRGSLDLAIKILESDNHIGMVGLKMKDTMGPAKELPYMGGISEYGILNCNHGVLPYDLLKSLGFFNEAYRSYTIDPDLTASVLCTGKAVVMTKKIAVLHHREWTQKMSYEQKQKLETGKIDNPRIYLKKFRFLAQDREFRIRLKVGYVIQKLFFSDPGKSILGLNSQDMVNLVNGRFIAIWDPPVCLSKPYHLVQKIPDYLLLSKNNPYRHLIGQDFND